MRASYILTAFVAFAAALASPPKHRLAKRSACTPKSGDTALCCVIELSFDVFNTTGYACTSTLLLCAPTNKVMTMLTMNSTQAGY
jgi:hypothetical protein